MEVRKTLTVAAPESVAFEVFTSRMATWWPMTTHHIGKVDCKDVVVEPKAAGRWFERGIDGSECEWGRVLVWSPTKRVVLDWQITNEWSFNPELHTEVEITFEAVDAGSTRVVLVHRGLEAYGAAAEQMKQIFDSDGGWTGILARYVDAAAR